MERNLFALTASASALLALFTLSAAAAPRVHAPLPEVPHFDLEMTSQEYTALLEQQKGVELRVSRQTRDALDPIIALGKRNLDWLVFINNGRPDGQKLSFSSAATQGGIPITNPSHSSPSIIQNNLTQVQAAMPAELSAMLFGTGAFTANPPVDDDTYLTWGRKVDSIYQAASRWLLEEPSLSAYEARRTTDIRGYYYLTQETDLEKNLTNWAQLSTDDQARLTPWLEGICFNTEADDASCATLFTAATDKLAFYQKYITYAKSIYDGFFILVNPRRDVKWTSADPNTFNMPFATPSAVTGIGTAAEIQKFLSDNIQDEWRFGDWHLILGFKTPGLFSSTVKATFVAGATPHVNTLGGNTITMDADEPLSEYNVQWTIRHEFGHTLGFPDCYTEFYDSTAQEMISYQLDLTDLMCSRTGHIQQQHVDQLRLNYYKQ